MTQLALTWNVGWGQPPGMREVSYSDFREVLTYINILLSSAEPKVGQKCDVRKLLCVKMQRTKWPKRVQEAERCIFQKKS